MFFSLLLIVVILVSIRKQSLLNFNSFLVFSILYLICFGILPVIYLSIDVPYNYSKGWLRFININKINDAYLISYACFLSLLGYVLYLLGYKIKRFKPKQLISFNFGQKKLLARLSFILLIIGMSTFAIYLSSLGSIVSGFIENNRMLFEEDRVESDSSYSFFFMFSKILLAASYMLWGTMKIEKTKVSKFLFWFAFLVSFLYLFRSAGRLSIITFLFTFGLAEAVIKNKIPVLRIIALSSIAAFITLFGKSLFRIFIYDNAMDNSYARYEDTNLLFPVLDFLGEFSFPFLSLTSNLSINSNWLWFKDLMFSFTYVFPAAFFPTVESTSLQNTINVIGPLTTKSGVPSDILSYGYLNFGLFGLFLIPFLFGIVSRWFDSFKKHSNNPLSTIFTIALSFIIGFRMMYFDPKHLLKGSFYFLFASIVIWIVLKINRITNKKTM